MDGVDVPCEPTPWGTLTCGSRLADLKGAPLSPLGCPRSRGFKALSARRRSADAELDETIESTVADTADDPEITLQKKSRNELLRQALAKLSPDHREIIDLVYYHETSVDDAAQILSIPSATVKTRMFYARKKLAVPWRASRPRRTLPRSVHRQTFTQA
jgi:predicted DNA-binding protein (UPF0251 family)